MSKRFTNTTKWTKNPWFRALRPRHKLLWLFLVDECDQVGSWKVDLQLASMLIGDRYTDQDLKALEPKVMKLRNQEIWIPSFIVFQYATLKATSPAHKGIARNILRLIDGLPVKDQETVAVISSLKSVLSSETLSDPPGRVDDSTGKGKGKGEGKDPKKKKADKFDFESVYQLYPRKIGKADGMHRLRETITTQDQYDAFKKAVTNYAKSVAGRDLEKIKHFDTFVGPMDKPFWPDFIDYDPTAKTQAPKRDYSYLLNQGAPA